MKDNFEKTPFLFSTLILVLSVFAFLALYMKIAENNQVAEQAILDWETELDRREDIKSLERTLKSIEKEKFSFESHFADGSDIVPFLNTIEKSAGAVGADLEITSVDAPGDAEALFLEAKAKGSFESLYKLLSLLENSPYELELHYAYLNRPGTGSSSSDPLKASQWELMLKFKLLSFVK